MNQKQADRIVDSWIEIMNYGSVYAEAVIYGGEWYMFTRGTGEGEFLYELDDVEIWVSLRDQDDSYQNFCDETNVVNSPVELIKYVNNKYDLDLCHNGTCDSIIHDDDDESEKKDREWLEALNGRR